MQLKSPLSTNRYKSIINAILLYGTEVPMTQHLISWSWDFSREGICVRFRVHETHLVLTCDKEVGLVKLLA